MRHFRIVVAEGGDMVKARVACGNGIAIGGRHRIVLHDQLDLHRSSLIQRETTVDLSRDAAMAQVGIRGNLAAASAVAAKSAA
jgi:hypothetical protein